MTADLLPTLVLIGLSVMTSVLGQTTIKLGVSQPGSNGLSIGDPTALLTTIVQSPLVLSGLVLYGIGALAWIVVLSRLDLSLAYPFVALNFVLITIISKYALAEPIPTVRWIGIGFIAIGILLIARGASAG